ncbi:hypothetical protein ROBYS_09880 [Roseobacter sp. OBYS 0001]|nr:hypothetical protein ROBYS_09880 [Roseobacter sp. OBYS 0001]
MKLRPLSVFYIVAACYGVIWLSVRVLALNVHPFDGHWEDQGEHYSTHVSVKMKTKYCLCGAYECETGFEDSLLARRTVFGWRRFNYFRDPKTIPLHLEQNYRPINVRGGKEFCVTKKRGERLKITLTPYRSRLWLDIE